MSYPTLIPASTVSAVTLPSQGTRSEVANGCPYGVYNDSDAFLTGAANQVNYVYKKLGGDILDIELTEHSVYAAYEEAVLEYSYIINLHQATNLLPSALGSATGSFDSMGEMVSGSALSGTLSGSHVALKYPKFDYAMARRVSNLSSAEVGLKDSAQYSASFAITAGIQDYDLGEIFKAATNVPYAGKVDNKKILIKRVFYKTPHAMWRFYGYYGGLNVVGNLHNYGQYSDDSSFQLVPAWQNKQQAMAFEDAIYTRMSHFTYEIRNNDKIRIFPIPRNFSPSQMWVEFSIPTDAWVDEDDPSIDGVNNMNTLPLGNLPYISINSIGKQWIRRFALALCKEVLGQVRSKFGNIPVPGNQLQLNGTALLSEAKDEQQKLREELKTTLAEMTYTKISEQQSSLIENSKKALEEVPNLIFVG